MNGYTGGGTRISRLVIQDKTKQKALAQMMGKSTSP